MKRIIEIAKKYFAKQKTYQMTEKKDNDAHQLHKEFLNYLIDATRYHFGQFNVWTMFFVTINGGLFVAFYSKDTWEKLNEHILIFITGYIISFLFFCCSRIYNLCINNLSDEINNMMNNFKKKYQKYAEDTNKYHKCYFVLEYTKKATTIIVNIISCVLMCSWVVLFVIRIFNDINIWCGLKKETMLCCMIIVALIITVALLLLLSTIIKNYHKKYIESKLKNF